MQCINSLKVSFFYLFTFSSVLWHLPPLHPCHAWIAPASASLSYGADPLMEWRESQTTQDAALKQLMTPDIYLEKLNSQSIRCQGFLWNWKPDSFQKCQVMLSYSKEGIGRLYDTQCKGNARPFRILSSGLLFLSKQSTSSVLPRRGDWGPRIGMIFPDQRLGWRLICSTKPVEWVLDKLGWQDASIVRPRCEYEPLTIQIRYTSGMGMGK